MSVNTDTMDSSYILHIRSKDVKQLTDGYNTDMLIDLQASIQRTNQNQDIHVSLSSAEIPVSWYAISSTLSNNVLYVDGALSLTVPNGNYDIYELLTYINGVGAFPYSLVYNKNQGTIQMTNTDATLHTINFGDSESEGFAKIIGYDRINIIVGGGGVVTGDNVINLQSIHSIFLHSDLNIENVIATGENVSNFQSIIDKIPVKVPPFSIIHYNPYDTSPFSSKVDVNSIRTFRISLKDQNSRLLQLNDVSYEISLIFEVHDRKKFKNISIEKDIIIDKPIGGRRRGLIEETIETQSIEETDEDIPPFVRTQSRRELPPIDENLPVQYPLIKEQTIIKEIKPINRIISPSEQELKSDDITGDLLNAVLQAKLLNVN